MVGRYILTPRIFHHLQHQTPGAGGEIQLTDAIAALLGDEDVFAYEFEGVRYDCGSKLDYLKANLAFAVKHPRSARSSARISNRWDAGCRNDAGSRMNATPEQAWRILETADEICSAECVTGEVARIAREVTAKLGERHPLVLGVMRGSVIFAGQLLPQLRFPLTFDYLDVTRYRSTTVGGEITWKVSPGTAVAGRVVLVVDDILDEGHTLAAVRASCSRRARRSSTARSSRRRTSAARSRSPRISSASPFPTATCSASAWTSTARGATCPRSMHCARRDAGDHRRQRPHAAREPGGDGPAGRAHALWRSVGRAHAREHTRRAVAFLARHGYGHTIPPHKVNYRANMWALNEQRVKYVVAVASVGGIRPDLTPGTLVVPDQIIDYTYGREFTYFDGTDRSVVHVDFTQPYCEALRERLFEAAERPENPSSRAAPMGRRRVRGWKARPRSTGWSATARTWSA